MNAKQIKAYFENPEKMNSSILISLQQAVKDFPYAAALHVLYMKALKNEDSYQLPAQVKRTAITVPDPSLIKSFYDSSYNHELPAIEFDIDALNAQAKIKIKNKKTTSKDLKKTLETVWDKTAHEVVSKKDEKVEPIANKVSKPTTVTREPDNFNHLPENVRNAILRSKKLNNSTSEESTEVIKVPAQKKRISSQKKQVTIKADENLTTDKSNQQKKHKPRRVKSTREASDFNATKVKDNVRIMPFSEKASFLEWLNADYYVEVKKVNSSQEFAKIEVVRQEDEFGEGEVHRIIKKLPKFEPTISDGKINVFNLEADEEGRFVTETLAEIYFNQRVYDKAIKAYEILSLKYPEKSSFFAHRIKAIKKEKNS